MARIGRSRKTLSEKAGKGLGPLGSYTPPAVGLGFKNPAEFGPVGTSDDATVLQAAINYCSANSLELRITRLHNVGSPLVIPVAGVVIGGTHVPKWQGTATPACTSGFSATSGFPVSRGVIEPAVGSRSYELNNLGILGATATAAAQGIRFNTSESAAETGAQFRSIEIAGFKGDGVTGAHRVGEWTNVFVHNNEGYGYNIGANGVWFDTKFFGCFTFYNRLGGWRLIKNPSTSLIPSLLTWIGCRSERNGQTAGNPLNSPTDSAWNAASSGWRIEAGYLLTGIGCETDANTGPGLDIQLVSGGTSSDIASVSWTAGKCNRDGTGAQVGTTSSQTTPGVRVRGFDATHRVSHVTIRDMTVSPGASDDAGSGTIISPRYGVDTEYVDFLTCESEDILPGTYSVLDSFHSPSTGSGAGTLGDLWRPVIKSHRAGLDIQQQESPSNTPWIDGNMRWSAALGLQISQSGAWVAVGPSSLVPQVVVYSGGAYPARPATSVAPAGWVTYIGPVVPTTWLANDQWINNS